MHLESGPAKADRNWHIARALLFLGFAGYFLYDGAIGYPADNHSAALQKLQTTPFKDNVTWDQLGDAPTQLMFENAKQRQLVALADLENLLGKPAFMADGRAYFASRYGFGSVPVVGQAVVAEDMSWTPWAHTQADIRGQFYWALIPVLPGLYFLWRIFKALTLRVALDDAGITYGRQRIAWEDVTALRDYNRKGWIDLYYKANDDEKKLRIDHEKVAKFGEIIDAVCERMGFENEYRAYQNAVAADEHAAAEDDAAAKAAEDALDDADETSRE